MNEYPLLLSTPMVQALAAGLKYQTRRVMQRQPDCQGALMPTPAGQLWYVWPGPDGEDRFCNCPFGMPGAHLWVRQTWATVKTLDHLPPSKIWQYEHQPMIYFASWTGSARDSEWRGKWRPSIFMPKWATQHWLEVADVQVQQIQSISYLDCIAEGIEDYEPEGDPIRWCHKTPERLRADFHRLWDSINADRGWGWETNCWVWVITFRRLEQARNSLGAVRPPIGVTLVQEMGQKTGAPRS